MKVAVSSSGTDLDSQIDPRFGRCAYFIIYDTDNMNFEALDNDSMGLGRGAGIQSAQFIADKGATAVLTGNCGPNAVQTLSAAGVQLFVGQSGTVREALERFRSNELSSTREANVSDHFGMQDGDPAFRPGTGSAGRGRGMGGGRGMGRGMGMGGGRGMGRGMGISGGNESVGAAQRGLTEDQELNSLKRESEELMSRMEDIQERIRKLEKGK